MKNKILHSGIYRFEECRFCKDCNPTAESDRQISPSCDRCLMGSEPDRFKPMWKTDREVALELSMRQLIDYNELEDCAIKDLLIDLVWEHAHKALNHE